MARRTGTFSAAGQESAEVRVKPGQAYWLSLAPNPSLTGSIQLLARTESPERFEVVATFTAANTGTEYVWTGPGDASLKLRCVAIDDGTETVVYNLRSLLSGKRILCDVRPKVGATAGWVINAANNTAIMATLPASRTANTMVLRLDHLGVGEVIEGFYPVGQVESGGNNASLTVELRKHTAAAADVLDATVVSTGSVTYAADTALTRITQAVDDLDIVVQDNESYYFLITGTTAASTDFALQGIMVQYRNGIA